MVESSEKLNNQAIILAEHGEFAEAIACLKRAITVEQENYLLWFNLGITYRDSGNLRAAKAAMEKALSYNDEDEEIVEALAILCFSEGSLDEAMAYCEAAFKMYYHVASFLKQISDTDGLELGEFDWVGTCVYQAITELSNKLDWLNSWNRLFGDGDEGMLFYSPDPVPADDKFAMAHKKIFKRKLLLYFISKVGEAPQNANNKYFRCGLRIDEILAKEWIRQEFYWNRTVFFLDRSKKMNFTNYGRKLWDSTHGLIGKTFKSTLIPEDRSIWNDKVEGQILFSDQEDKTLNFQGEGLHEESSSNIGTMDHLKKELMAIK